MSTAAAARSAPRAGPAADDAPRRLRLVPAPRPRPKRGAFVLLVVVLLVGGLLDLLALNTALAQDAFVVQDLQQQQAQLDDQAAAAPAAGRHPRVAGTARGPARMLGMDPGGRPALLRPRERQSRRRHHVRGGDSGPPPGRAPAPDCRAPSGATPTPAARKPPRRRTPAAPSPGGRGCELGRPGLRLRISLLCLAVVLLSSSAACSRCRPSTPRSTPRRRAACVRTT